MTDDAKRIAWLAERKKSIGASDAAAILGINPWRNALDVFRDKIGDDVGNVDSWPMQRGRAMEPVVAGWYAEQTGAKIEDRGATVITRHPEHDWIGATIDRVIVGDDGEMPLEIKTANNHSWADWQDGAPLYYQVQVQLQMACMGAVRGVIAVGHMGFDTLEHFEYDRDDAFLAALLPKLREFWDHVERREPPQIDPANARAMESIRAMYPASIDGLEVELPSDVDMALAELADLRDAEKNVANQIATRRAMIMQAMQDAEKGITPSGKIITFKTQNRSAYTVEPCTMRVLRLPNIN